MTMPAQTPAFLPVIRPDFRGRFPLPLILLLLVFSGDVLANNDSERVYKGSFDAVYQAAEAGLQRMFTNITDKDEDSIRAFIPAQVGRSAGRIRLFIEPVSDTETRVRIDPESTSVLRNFPRMWRLQLFQEIERALPN